MKLNGPYVNNRLADFILCHFFNLCVPGVLCANHDMFHGYTDISGIDLVDFDYPERDKIDFLYAKILDFSKPVFPNPNKEVIETYLLPLNEAIVLLPLSTQTPVMMLNDFKTKTIEGLLVSACLVENICYKIL